jgi:hypothetical protein
MQPDHEDTNVGAQATRTRLILALVAWVVVGSITVGSLLYTALGRVLG